MFSTQIKNRSYFRLKQSFQLMNGPRKTCQNGWEKHRTG